MTIVVHKNSSRIHSGLFVIEGVPAPFNDYFFYEGPFLGQLKGRNYVISVDRVNQVHSTLC